MAEDEVVIKVRDMLASKVGESVLAHYTGSLGTGSPHMTAEERASVVTEFATLRARVVVATEGFGRGLSFPKVKATAILGIRGINLFWQMAGRTAREQGENGISILYYPKRREPKRPLEDYYDQEEHTESLPPLLTACYGHSCFRRAVLETYGYKPIEPRHASFGICCSKCSAPPIGEATCPVIERKEYKCRGCSAIAKNKINKKGHTWSGDCVEKLRHEYYTDANLRCQAGNGQCVLCRPKQKWDSLNTELLPEAVVRDGWWLFNTD